MELELNNFGCYENKKFIFNKNDLVLISGKSGIGKCFEKDTELILFDRTLKKIQDISFTDYILGIDGSPKRLANKVKGYGDMYEISNISNIKSFVCNREHILTLIDFRENVQSNKIKIGVDQENEDIYFNIINISLKEYMKLNNKKNLCLFHKPIYEGVSASKFKYQEINNNLFNPDFLSKILIYDIFLRKEICKKIIESVGFVFDEFYVNIFKFDISEQAIDLLIRLFFSVGFMVNCDKDKITLLDNEWMNLGILFDTNTFSGINHSIYNFNVTYKGKDEFYGFELFDDDKRFYLRDNTVVHNSTIFKAIRFAITGAGTKLPTYGSRICSVIFSPSKKLKIIRNKCPNKLVVTYKNKNYEELEAQHYINNFFGNNIFDMVSYIPQNIKNSFILMTPLDKLNFLEKISFSDIDLKEVKTRIREKISEKSKELIALNTKLEVKREIFDELIKPEKINLLSDKSVQELEEENKLLSEKILIKENNIEKLKRQHINMIEKKHKYESILNNIVFLENQLSKISSDNKDVSIFTVKELKSKITKKREVIEDLENYREKQKLENELTTLELKLEEYQKHKSDQYLIKKKELEQILEVNITDSDEYDRKSDIFNILTEKIEMEKLIDSLIIFDSSELEHTKLELQSKLEKNQKISMKLELKKKELRCPNCDFTLYLEKGKLKKLEENEELDINEINNRILKIDQENKNIQKSIKEIIIKIDFNNKNLKLRNSYNKKLNTINSNLEKNNFIDSKLYDSETINYELSKDKHKKKNCSLCLYLDELEKYLENSDEKDEVFSRTEKELNKLKNEETNNKDNYSSSLEKSINLIKKKMNKINLIQNNANDFDKVDEESLYEEIHSYEKQITIIENIENLNNKINNERKRLIEFVDEEDINKIKSEINECENTIKEQKQKLRLNQEYINNIIEYKKIIAQRNKYIRSKKEITKLEEQIKNTNNESNMYSIIAKEIALTESKVINNVIENLNICAKIYLDKFFEDDPISVNIYPYKKVKKELRSSINVDIFYKGIEYSDITSLSGGEISRIVLAFTLAFADIFNSPIVLLDECISSLDYDTTSNIIDCVKEFCSNKSMFFISHQVIEGSFGQIINL